MSAFLALNWKDVIKAVVMAFLSAFLTAVYSAISTGVILDWPGIKAALIVGATAAIAYLLKNFFSVPAQIPPTDNPMNTK